MVNSLKEALSSQPKLNMSLPQEGPTGGLSMALAQNGIAMQPEETLGQLEVHTAHLRPWLRRPSKQYILPENIPGEMQEKMRRSLRVTIVRGGPRASRSTNTGDR